MLAPEVIEAINRVLHEELDPLGFQRAEIAEDEDHDGDPILRITLHYRKSEDALDLSPTFRLAQVVKAAARPLGEMRFPHFRHQFVEGQKLKAA